jgi:beta-barrel assembly-enhancing protease
MKTRTKWIALMLGAALSGSAFAQIDLNAIGDMLGKAGDVVVPKDEADEQAIGREWAAMLVGAAPLVADEKMQRYVNKVGRWVAQQSERPNLPWRFGVLDSENVNAFATPGGWIFVTRGLMARLSSEAELAGVLGHEIAHVVRQHHLAAIRKTSGIGLGADLLVKFGLSKTEHANASEKLLSGAKEVMLRGLDKSDEYEADRMGVVLATRAGYDPYGLPAVIQAIEAMSADDSSVALLFQTHPAPGARLDALGEAMGERFEAYVGQPQAAERFAAEVAR